MRVEIGNLHQRLGNTMIYVTHDQVEAMTMADRIAVLRETGVSNNSASRSIFITVRPTALSPVSLAHRA